MIAKPKTAVAADRLPSDGGESSDAGKVPEVVSSPSEPTPPIQVLPEAPAPIREPRFTDPVELSDDEVLEIRAWALAEAKKEQKQRKVDAMKTAALEQARRDMGLLGAKQLENERLNELVAVTIDLPEAGAPDGVRLDQHVFRHGLTYTVTRAVYETIMDIQNKAWIAEAVFDGKRRTHYNAMRGRYEQAYGGGSPGGTRIYHAGGTA